LDDIKAYNKNDKNGKYKTVGFYQASLTLERSRNARYYIKCPDGRKCIPPENKRWRCVEKTFLDMLDKGEIEFIKTPNSPLIDEKGNKSDWNVYTKQYLDRRMGEGKTPRDYVDTITNVIGTKEIKSLKIPFDFPKPTKMVEHLARLINTKSSDIVLDFFSGSATTAHAVMQLNAEDGGKRKFIMVQLPEKTDENSEAYKAGYKTIADIGKERIRRAGKKIVEALKAKNQQLELGQERIDASKLDIGFRVYKTDESNMKDVFYHPAKLDQKQLTFVESNIKEDRTPEDLLTQVILDLGLELSLPIETKKIGKNTAFIVQTNALVACFDNDIDFKIVDTIAGLKPFKVVFKDASFKDDKDRINVEERFKRLSPETKVTVI
jgi:adenine-specific DNA-methyltransferase